MIPSIEDILSRADSILPLLELLEQRRRRSMAFIKYMLIMLLAFLSAHLVVIIIFSQPYYYFIISALAAALVASWTYKHFFTDQGLALDLRDTLFKALLPVMLPLPPMFEQGRHIAFKYFQDSQLFLHFPSSFGGANAVKGGAFEASFLYSEIEAYVGDGKDELCIFNGMFYVFGAFGDYNPSIRIVPNRLQKRLGLIGKKIRRHSAFRGKAAKLFDETFENEFSVYCESSRYAQDVLTEEIRRQLLAFHAATGADIYMSFVGRKIYVGLHNCPAITFSMRKPCNSLSYISEMATRFMFPIRLVSAINQKLIPPKAPPSWDI
ncbi:DUF3137 domain-containing protein [Rhodoflexus sp.]